MRIRIFLWLGKLPQWNRLANGIIFSKGFGISRLDLVKLPCKQKFNFRRFQCRKLFSGRLIKLSIWHMSESLQNKMIPNVYYTYPPFWQHLVLTGKLSFFTKKKRSKQERIESSCSSLFIDIQNCLFYVRWRYQKQKKYIYISTRSRRQSVGYRSTWLERNCII